MKLEVGMYVRKVNGNIEKITGVQDVKYTTGIQRYFSCSEPEECFSTEDDITKASHNIIDLIEVGDYVNGVEVMEVDLEEKPYLKFVHGISTTDVGLITYMGDSKLYGIKSIVTKEQFANMEYKVGD